MRKIVVAAIALAVLSGCAYNGHINSVSGAAEIMPSRQIDADADVRIAPEISNATKKVSTGYVCSAHTFTISAGAAIAESIIKTMEGAFRTVSRVETQQERTGAYFLDFSLAEFHPRLRFNPGFWVVTPDASTELAIKVRATKPDGTLAFQTTARGEGSYEDNVGGCEAGMKVAEEATRKAVQRAMEDLAQKLINSRVLTED